MTDDQIYQLVVQSGIGAAALGIIGKICLRVAERMITAIDALSKEARDTGRATVDALSHLTERLSRLEGKVEILATANPSGPNSSEQWPENEFSEVRRVRERERARSPAPEMAGEYGPMKPPRR